ncbi:MAG: GspH/FimT family pseudopilin [Parvularculaceae bacterium]|nr:GspH/FimT family pseudopilin [Parvularculaceae bacterium]
MDRRKLARRKQRGLTLVELLVVIVILALASSVVMMNAPPSRPDVRDDAERFAARISLAFDEAIAGDAPLRIRIDTEGYGFETLKDGEWTPADNIAPLARREFHRRTSALVEVRDAANENAPALGEDETGGDEGEDGVSTIPLDPLGAQTPFNIRFSSAEGVWSVSVDETGAVRVSDDG